jgi:hypothetical protein
MADGALLSHQAGSKVQEQHCSAGGRADRAGARRPARRPPASRGPCRGRASRAAARPAWRRRSARAARRPPPAAGPPRAPGRARPRRPPRAARSCRSRPCARAALCGYMHGRADRVSSASGRQGPVRARPPCRLFAPRAWLSCPAQPQARRMVQARPRRVPTSTCVLPFMRARARTGRPAPGAARRRAQSARRARRGGRRRCSRSPASARGRRRTARCPPPTGAPGPAQRALGGGHQRTGLAPAAQSRNCMPLNERHAATCCQSWPLSCRRHAGGTSERKCAP